MKATSVLLQIKNVTNQIKTLESTSVPYKYHSVHWGIPTPRTIEEKLLRELYDLLKEVSVSLTREHRLLYLQDRNRLAEVNEIFVAEIRPYLEAAELIVWSQTLSNLIRFCEYMYLHNDHSKVKCAKSTLLYALKNFEYANLLQKKGQV